ncbi:MAG: DNA polymerase domain-containing protein [Candidatus Bathycorpusculaceae bacterium]
MIDWKNNFVKLNAVKGWLLDVYPSYSNEMIVWMIAENGERVRLVDKFLRRIYVSGSLPDLQDLAEKIGDDESIFDLRLVEKYADFTEASKSTVLEVDIGDYSRVSFLARKILELGHCERFRLCNVDVPVSQAYLYERDVFPLAHVLVVDSGNRLGYDVLDSAESCEYAVPPFRSLWLNVSIKREGGPPRFSNEIENITLESGDWAIVISDGSEADKLLELVKTVEEVDPDLIFTHGGDSFLLPYLAHRASVNGNLDGFILSRDAVPLKAENSQGRTFFSYGRVYHKAPTRRLYGRVHIDVDNTFIYAACGLDGLSEASRTCRVLLHRAARASIGSIMSSLQLYIAYKDGILVPWKRHEPESFKSAWDLLVADRGGFVFEPKIGFHTDVVEVDFASMFPVLMLTRNISAETVLCKCCPNSELKVPELGYNICEKKLGIVPKTLALLLKKRFKYKSLMEEAEDERQRRTYDMRQAALKWILVTCFGYLGYRNARFGKVDAHVAVCAFARDALLKTARMAEEHGFEVIHGIVDSLWLKKSGFSPKEVADFCREVSSAIGVPLNVEGKYRWIIFLPSKVFQSIPVLNRYYGVFEDGKVKMRGIEARRRDTPNFIREAQVEMINALAKSADFEDFLSRIPRALSILREYAARLISNKVDAQDLLITKRLSKPPSSYRHDVFQAIAARQLERAGYEVSAGQTVQYLVVDSKCRIAKNRVLAEELLEPKIRYDVEKYLDMLISSAETLLGVFGYNKNRIRDILLHEKQITLN